MLLSLFAQSASNHVHRLMILITNGTVTGCRLSFLSLNYQPEWPSLVLLSRFTVVYTNCHAPPTQSDSLSFSFSFSFSFSPVLSANDTKAPVLVIVVWINI